ncbi:MAG: biopolymer transporter ExbD, partial [Rhodobacteraceae bacterium]|nr:biopolymer transporter ExbD [Paracoccaceae bacterium]
MRLAAPRPTRPREPVVPMINVVFLLLIFFLMAAVIAPPEPFGVTLPRAAADDPPATGGARQGHAERLGRCDHRRHQEEDQQQKDH